MEPSVAHPELSRNNTKVSTCSAVDILVRKYKFIAILTRWQLKPWNFESGERHSFLRIPIKECTKIYLNHQLSTASSVPEFVISIIFVLENVLNRAHVNACVLEFASGFVSCSWLVCILYSLAVITVNIRYIHVLSELVSKKYVWSINNEQ